VTVPAWPQVHRSTLLGDWPEAMADFPAVVRRFMQMRGISLRRLARTTHYDPSYLSKVLSGRKPVTPHLGARLDDALGAGGQIRDAADEQASRRPVKAARPSPDRPRSRVAEALYAAADTGTTGLDVAASGLSELIPHYSHLVSTTTSAAVYDELLSVRRSPTHCSATRRAGSAQICWSRPVGFLPSWRCRLLTWVIMQRHSSGAPTRSARDGTPGTRS